MELEAGLKASESELCSFFASSRFEESFYDIKKKIPIGTW